MTVHQQTGSRGLERRSHSVLECRNFIAAYVKRSDQASRRVIRYLSMQSHQALLLVRDAKTGQTDIPPERRALACSREERDWKGSGESMEGSQAAERRVVQGTRNRLKVEFWVQRLLRRLCLGQCSW